MLAVVEQAMLVRALVLVLLGFVVAKLLDTLLSKLLGENSVLTTLNLSDNQIHAEGGRYLARGLRENDSLLQLNLRLNRLTDEGCSLLLEGLRDNVNLIELNLGSNGAGSQVTH